jgi:hypothetical protein
MLIKHHLAIDALYPYPHIHIAIYVAFKTKIDGNNEVFPQLPCPLRRDRLKTPSVKW